jgi:hypothetical protein
MLKRPFLFFRPLLLRKGAKALEPFGVLSVFALITV